MARTTGALSYAECSRCGGLFLSNAVFDKVVQGADARAVALAVERDKPPSVEHVPARFHYRKCPECGKLMFRRNYGGGSGVILDVCGKDGVFLDRGELTGIVQFLEEGGLDRLKKRERERLEREISALEARKRGASLGSTSIADATEGSVLAWLIGWLGGLLGRALR